MSKTRAHIEFDGLKKMFDLGLPVPRPVAARIIRQGIFYRAELITQEIENATTIGSANKNTKINKKVDCVVTKAFASTKKTLDIANSFLEKPFTLMLLKGKLETINKEIVEANISKENYEIIKIQNEKEKHILKIRNE